ncbi:DNA primase [Candidatus Saccharibacteria bacterium]|nr:DNA primase [Candidatus Saccharibacteria bacterium]MBI3337844.1 DNA primase [Candidatus Saccharibacteria bacterium]
MDAVEEIKSRLSIEDVVGEYVQLKRAGRNFKGLSPFSNEKTASFMVSPEKQIWHDFSSAKGGNMFSFVMEMEGLDFKETLELLARKAGVDLSQYQNNRTSSNIKVKERLYEALELAAKFYQIHFSKNKTALDYVLKKRAFSKDTALLFRLGYAPADGSALTDFLKKKGFSDKELQQAGLAVRGYDAIRDMFRGRLMIPLQDPQGRIIGFTARILNDEPNAPKYINTPQTLLYDKGRHVYGLHLAKEAIRTHKYSVVVEGNLDVIASHQAKVTQVVATAGTAVTQMHLKALSRFSSDIRLAFDQDSAGQAAAERAIPIASKVGASLSIIDIPSGKDPDELIKKDPKLWEAAIDKRQYALDWLIDRYVGQLDLKSATGKRQFSDILIDVVKQLDDSVEQDHYLRRIAGTIDVSIEVIRSKFKQNKTAPRMLKRHKVIPKSVDERQLEAIKAQNQILSIVLKYPNLRSYLERLNADMLIEDDAKSLFVFLQKHPEFAGNPITVKQLEPIADYVKMLILQYEAFYQGVEAAELSYETAHLQQRLIELYVKSKKLILSEELRDTNEVRTQTLLKEVKELDQLLKRAGDSHAQQ